ncbi:hypothetical protein QOZ80_1BG0081440 [Eleusine coracana subsp. coracana]|nr:hypothetical protein QOZ80_1BG0081440 [Eleusine coracana subsp. coracana]
METFISAVLSDLISRSVSLVIDNYYRWHKGEDENLQRLLQMLLRVQVIVEEAEERHITNCAMLQQLQMLRETMYKGLYLLDTSRYSTMQLVPDDQVGGRPFLFSKLSPAKRMCFSTRRMNITFQGDKLKEVQKMLGNLHSIINDMAEFIVFLKSYPPISREPYSKYLFLEKCMFGRQAEMENIICFLLQPEPPGVERLQVLPIVGPPRVGKSTLVEHVFCDQRVRNHFSSIILCSGDPTAPEGSEVVKKQMSSSRGRSLIVMELAVDFSLNKQHYRKLHFLRSHMPPGSKIIITSRSESILKLGTSEPIRLTFLPQEAYWYFFKVMAFGSTNPEVHPELASIAMELAAELDGSFLVANLICGLMRTNIQTRFWRKILELHKHHVERNRHLFGEHPHTLLHKKNQVVYVWCLSDISMRLKVHYCEKLYHPNEVPNITLHDVMIGSAKGHGKFDVVAWKSCIPPYHNHLMTCEIEAPRDMMGKKKRPHFMSIHLRDDEESPKRSPVHVDPEVHAFMPEDAEHMLQRLQRVLLRIDAMVEEAEGRHITSKAMLRQLQLLRQGMYHGHYMLDTFRCRDHGGDEEVNGGRAVALLRPRFSTAKRRLFSPVNDDTDNQQNTMLDADSLRKLEKVVDGLEMLMGNMPEFAVLLGGYPPRICRQPYGTYLILDKVMFGRHMEKETILNFLLRPEATGDENPGVLPIVGEARVGKSTLVEHVCLDERVRNYFRFIVFFSSDNLGCGNMAALREIGVIKHQDLTTGLQGRSLAVIELTGDIEEETWRRLSSSATSSMGHGSKIIITSRSEKIVALGTTHALRLKVLPREAFWYFFKALAFGSADPDDQPKLLSLGMEISTLLNSVFLRANIVSSLLRTNQNVQFWHRVLQCLRDYTSKHVCTFGKHPSDLVSKSQPVYPWSMVRSQNVVEMSKFYQKPSPYHGVPKLRVQEFLTECVIDHGKFDMLMWRSNIPPYYAYAASCVSEPSRCSMANKKRPRHARER